ncbi:erythromycin esterase family protein [Actinomadura spongiicola]|nr:erythromycin esterase family protein [Actinomadura spongiicola]
MPISVRRRATPVFVGLAALLTTLAVPQTARAETADPVVRAIESGAHPLRSTEPAGDPKDLKPLGAMVDGATVVGLGEATHNSREFFTMKHRVFRYLVREKGFRAFSQEVHVAAGLRINDYVLYGRGDIRKIMNEEFQGGTGLWNTREYLDLFRWMRAYNARHTDRLHYVGNDLDFPGEELFARVDGYAEQHDPALLPQLTELYRGLRPTTDMDTWIEQYPQRPYAERRDQADRATRAVKLLRDRGADPMTVQYATFIFQVAKLYSYDFEDEAEMLKATQYREEAMADNTVWWSRQTGRTLLSAHNGHVAYGNSFPQFPRRIQGDLIREQIGRGYVSVGFTFYRGGFNASPPGGGPFREVVVGPAPANYNESTLDKVRYRDFVFDTRTVAPVARAWLGQSRPAYDFGTEYPDSFNSTVALGTFYDVVIHLHRVRAARLL